MENMQTDVRVYRVKKKKIRRIVFKMNQFTSNQVLFLFCQVSQKSPY